jgi:putative heme iron utilization protein
MENEPDSVALANALWSSSRHGVIGTYSLAQPGYPFGSVVPFVLDRSGLPLMLLSPLSQHTKNIDADPRCSLTLMEPGDGDVQQRARLSALGDVERIDAGDNAARYFRYFPHTRSYHGELGFVFYRFSPVRMHWNGGFATARWLGIDRVVEANPLDADTESRIVEHMNADHGDALRRYLGIDPSSNADDVEMLGIDARGIDLRQGEELTRVALPRPIKTPDEARQVLVEMAQKVG